MAHVFISYVRDNHDEVQRLCSDLVSASVDVWLDRNEIEPGLRWEDAIRRAIRQGDFFVACFSNEYLALPRTYMNEELTVAIEELRLRPVDRAWFIPVRLSDCEVPDRAIGAGQTLRGIQWVDLYEDWDEGIRRIVSVIRPIPRDVRNLVQGLQSDDPTVRLHAAEALGEIQAVRSVSALTQGIRDVDSDVRTSICRALGKIGDPAAAPALAEALKDAIPEVREAAVQALGNLADPSTVKDLVEVICDPREREHVCRAAASALEKIETPLAKAAAKTFRRITSLIRELGFAYDPDEDEEGEGWDAEQPRNELYSMGVDAVPALLRALRDGPHRDEAAVVLGRIGSVAAPDLIDLLRCGDRDVRWAAAKALGEIGSDVAVGPLAETLCDEDEYLRYRATMALVDIGHVSAAPALRKALRDPCGLVRDWAVKGLGKLRDVEAVSSLIEILAEETSEGLALEAAGALGEIQDERAVGPLIRALRSKRAGLREQAALALGHIGDENCLQALIEAAGDDDRKGHAAIAEALGEIGGVAAIRVLVKMLDEPVCEHQAAIEALVHIGIDSWPHLIQALTHHDRGRRAGAVYVLRNIGEVPASTVHRLVPLLNDGDAWIRVQVIITLKSYGRMATDALPRLLKALKDKNADVRRSAASAVGEIGDRTVLPDLCRAFHDDDEWVRFNAARAASKFGREAISILVEALKSRTATVRYCAVYALGHMGDDGQSALPCLRPLLSDADIQVRGMAAWALAQMHEHTDRVMRVLIESLATVGKIPYLCAYAKDALQLIGTQEAHDAILEYENRKT